MDRDSPENEPGVLTTPFEQVISICETFTGEYGAGAQPSIHSYLQRVGENSQPMLLRFLVAVEVENRRAAGERPHVDEYLERFPQHSVLLRDVFLDIASRSSVVPDETAEPKVATEKVPAISRLGEYRLLGQLGRGGMGVVYEALHVQRGNRVALKTLPSLDGAALHRFKREFRSLADTNHPNLIGLHTLEADGGQWFFTMDLIEGATFDKYVRPNGALDEARLRSSIAQLMTGVMALHSRHIIHRDLKPSNVMVTHDGHVVVLDFGLVLELDTAGFISRTTDKVAGTPKYMAPEQASAGKITSATDWYALGVMLYESLSGKPPFSGTVTQILQDKQRLDPPPLPDDPAIPADLGALCMRLLARDPQRRPDALEIANVIAASVPHVSEAVTHAGQPLVGREQHLAALKDTSRTLERHREPLTVFISGRSGEGKSTLAEHFLTPLRGDQRLAVMSGRCYDRESVPFKALDTLIDALSSFLRSLPGEDAALLMPDDIGALAQVFPVLQRVEVVARASDPRLSTLDEHQVRGRAFRALRSLLARISRRALIVWFIDDLQWGDADSAEALFEVLRPPEAPALLFLGAYRSDETEGSAFLRMWKELQRKYAVEFADHEVKVGPLTVEECTALVINLVGKDTESIRSRAVEFARETRGNPFLLTELVGCFDPETDSFQPMPLNELLSQKLGRLPTEAGTLLEVVAVSGQSLSLEEASRTAGHESIPVATLTRMRNERLIRLVGPEDKPLVDTYHDRVRESILGQMDDERCRSLHRALADVIEKDAGSVSAELVAALEGGDKQGENRTIPRVYDLAYHYDAAGVNRKAWIYALLAAEQAQRQSALEVAVNNYALAKRNADEINNAVRYRIAEGYGNALMLLGRYEEANEQLHGAIELVEDVEKKARIEALQGEVAVKQGMLGRGAAYYEQGLRRLGNRVPRTSIGVACEVFRETIIQCGNSLMPGRLHRKLPSSRNDLSVRLFGRLAHLLAFQNTIKLMWALLACMNRAEQVPPGPGLAFSYAFHAGIMGMLGWKSRGEYYGSRAIHLARGLDDLLGIGNSCNYRGIGLYASACYEESIATFKDSMVAYEKAGDLWEVHMAHFHTGCCQFGQGNLGEAVAQARWTFASSARIGDSRTMCSSWLWARATQGNLPFEELKSCMPCRPDDTMSTVHGVLAEGLWHNYHGRTAEALHAYERAAEMVRKTFCVNSHTNLLIPMLAMGLRLHADVVQQTDSQSGEELRKRAYRVAKWATRLTWLFPAAYPLALRERALILAACGKAKQALKYADNSCAVAQAQMAKYEHAQSLLVRGMLAKELGLPEGDEEIRTAKAALEVMERPVRETPPSRPDSGRQKPIEPSMPAEPTTPAAKRRRLIGRVVAILVAFVAAVLLGHVAGMCTEYVVGFAGGAIAADVSEWTTAGSGLGAVIGWVTLPVVLLLGWLLVRWGQRHHDAALARKPGECPSSPPALVRHGLFVVFGVLALSLSMIPVALGIWLGGLVAGAFGTGPGPWATTLAGLGGILGLAFPVILWRFARY